MLDLIFFCFFAGVFYAGFYCGKTYGTLQAMWTAIKLKIASFFN